MNSEEESFVESGGKKICFGCAVRSPFEHQCFGEVGDIVCECDNIECMIVQKRITLKEASKIVSSKRRKYLETEKN